MSTRCNIVVCFGNSKVYMYRHHDGYLAETGADLALLLAASGNDADDFLRSMFAARYEKASYEKEPRAIYELTNNFHGDIEKVYVLKFPKLGEAKKEVVIEYGSRPDSYPETEAWVNNRVKLTLEHLVSEVNRERFESNVRLRELMKKGKGYPKMDEYEMIELKKEAA